MKNFIFKDFISLFDSLDLNVNGKIKELEEALAISSARLIDAPEGRIVASKHGSGYQFYLLCNGKLKRSYLSKKDKDFICALCQKKYDLEAAKIIKEKLRILKDFKKEYEFFSIKDMQENLGDGICNNADKLFLSDKEYAAIWTESGNGYKTKLFKEGEAEFICENGCRVRSKSEMLIVDALIKHGVPFKYEFPFKCKNGSVLHPDFLCLNVKSRKEFFWEHFGMMSDSDYVDNMVFKMDLYRKSGLILGQDLIFTMETLRKPLTSAEICDVIQKYLV